MNEGTGDDTDDTGEPAAEEVAIAGSWPGFIIDLARLEWTIDQVFDGPGVEREPPHFAEQLAALPAECWPDARLELVPCLRLLRFRFPVNDYYTAFRAGDDPSIPDPRDTFAAITRRDYVVRRFELSRPQFDMLSALAQGQPVGEAIAQVSATLTDLDPLAASLQNWFHIWSGNGFFQRVRHRPC